MINADDFGFTPDVNEGIVEAHRHGILTATTMMANGEAFDDALRLARETPSLDIGAHLALVSGRSVLTGRPLPAGVPQLLAALARRQIRPYEELRAQVARLVDAGLRPTHLDTHKHTHLAPPVLDAVARIGEEFGIRWVRRPSISRCAGCRRPRRSALRAARWACCAAGSNGSFPITAARPPITLRASRLPAVSARRSWWS